MRVSSRSRRLPSIRGIDGRRKTTRLTMRFVPVKTADQQAVLMTHRVRDLLVRQLTQVTVAPQVRFQRNAIRAHLGECSIVAPKGVHNVVHLLAMAEGAALPESARQPMQFLAEQFRDTRKRIDAITADVKARAQMDTVARRLQTIPGIGPITASAIAASVPDVSNFNAARDLAASC